jgi:glycopeptide antibiotics resistance protein
VLYSIMPLDLTISVSELYDKYRAGQINLTPFRHAWPLTLHSAYELLRDVAMFVPMGALAYRQWPRLTSRAQLLGAIVAGVAVVAGIETAQTLVLSRFADVTDLITGGLGVTVGSALTHKWIPDKFSATPRTPSHLGPRSSQRTVAWLVALAVGYCALLFVAAWYPFEFNFDPAFLKPRVHTFVAAPLTTLYLSSEFAALTNAFAHTAWFVPLGVLADWCSRLAATGPATRRAWLTFCLTLILAAATAMEVGQIAIPARTASLDGVILRGLGAAVGIVASRFLAPLNSAPSGQMAAGEPLGRSAAPK